MLFRAMQLLDYDRWWVNDRQTAHFFEFLRDRPVTVPERTRAEYERQKANRWTAEAVLLEPYLTFSGGGYSFSGARLATRVRGDGPEDGSISQAGYQRMLERAHVLLNSPSRGTGYRTPSRTTGYAGVPRHSYQATLDRAHNLLQPIDLDITSWDYKAVLAELGPDDFAYLDPPYEDTDVRAYGPATIDHAELVEILKDAKFRWALSEFRNPRYIAAFGRPMWSMVRRITYGRPKSGLRPSGDSLPQRTECLWGNYSITHVRALAGRLGGQARSRAKREAARVNGRKGGRPRKSN